MRARIPEHAALVVYLLGPAVSAAWVVRRDRATFHPLDATLADVTQWTARLWQPIEHLRAPKGLSPSLSW